MSRLRRLGRDEGGQISFLTVFGAAAFAGLLGLVVTTGDQAAQKIRMQNAVDAAALSGGAWIARGLNLTSAINVTQTQLVGGAILLNALDDAIKLAQSPVDWMCTGYRACPFPLCPILALIVCFQADLLSVLSEGVSEAAKLLSQCSGGLFWKAAALLSTLNAGIHATFFGIAAFEAFEVAKQNGADLAVLLPGPLVHGKVSWQALTLPTREGDSRALCAPMEEGSPEMRQRGYSPLLGYPVDQGPYRLGKCRLSWTLALLTGFPPVGPHLFAWQAERHKAALCGGSPPQGVTRPATSLEECRSLSGQAHWRKIEIDVDESTPSEDGCEWLRERLAGGVDDFRSIPDVLVRREETVEQSCSETPPGREIDLDTYCRTTDSHPAFVPGSDCQVTDPARFFNTLEVWKLDEGLVEDQPTDDSGSASGGCTLPRPYLLAPEHDALRFLAFASKRNRRVFFGERFLENPPRLSTYAQVEVYNGISQDTFTQDWRVHLSRASLVDAPIEWVAAYLPDGAPAPVFERGTSLKDTLWQINNH